MAFINRVPRALQSILDGQTSGNNPAQMSDLVSGSIDILALYMMGRGWETRFALESMAAGLAGVRALITVPDGEIWGVRAISSRFDTAVAVPGWGFGPVMQEVSNSFGINLVPPLYVANPGIIIPFSVGAKLPELIWLVPGNILATECYQLTTGTTNIRTVASICRFVG